MSDDERGPTTWDRSEARARLLAVLRAKAAADESTVGTGSALAIGCSIATLIILVVGILILLVWRWF